MVFNLFYLFGVWLIVNFLLQFSNQLESGILNKKEMQGKRVLSKNLKVELIQVLFRHGARTPVIQELDVYNYLDNSVYEKLGIGALTNEGKMQEYELGLFLRDRYNNFLSTDYKSEELYAYATNSERTKMSLQLVLAGLYPPKDHSIWNPDLKWSPVPYSYTQHKFDILLRSFDRPKYRNLMREVYQSDEFVKRLNSYSDFLKFAKEKTGVEFDDAYKVAHAMGTLIAHENMRLPLPEWYTPEVKQSFIDIMENVYYDGYAFTPEMKKLGPGVIIKTFVENMNLNGTVYNPRKIYLYSAHDDNLATFIRAHDMQQFRYIPYGSGLVFEKLRDSENPENVYVRILAWTGKGQIASLKIGNHEEFCPIEDYLKIVEPVIPSDTEVHDMLSDIVTPAQLKDLFFGDPFVKKL